MEKLADISAFTELKNGSGISSCFNYVPSQAMLRKQNRNGGWFNRTRYGQEMNRYKKASTSPFANQPQSLQSMIHGALIQFMQNVDVLNNKRFAQLAESLQSAIAHAEQTKDFRFAAEAVKRVNGALTTMDASLNNRRAVVKAIHQDLVGIAGILKEAHAKKLL